MSSTTNAARPRARTCRKAGVSARSGPSTSMVSSSETDSPSEPDDSNSGIEDASEGDSESTDSEGGNNVNDATESGSVENQIEGDFE